MSVEVFLKVVAIEAFKCKSERSITPFGMAGGQEYGNWEYGACSL